MECLRFILFLLWLSWLPAGTLQLPIENIADRTFAINFLQKYGYLSESQNDLTSIEQAVTNFQDYFKLDDVDGLDDKTLELMRKPRCGVDDKAIINNYRTSSEKWNRKHLRWYFKTSTLAQQRVASKAFEKWGNVSGLSFEFSARNPDIAISMANGKNHTYYTRCSKTNKNCDFPFDGPSGVMAHAFFPQAHNPCIELHLDGSEQWYVNNFIDDEKKPPKQADLYTVMLHEIGHSLGLTHSNDDKSIMYPIYGGVHHELGQDDVTGIQTLYGKPNNNDDDDGNSTRNNSLVPTTASDSISSTAATTPKMPAVSMTTEQTIGPLKKLDLCSLDPKKLKFLIIRDNLYIFYEKWVWIMDLESRNIVSEQINIQSILIGVQSFNEITAVFQRPNKEIVLIISNRVYIISHPGFRVLQRLSLHQYFRISDTSFNVTAAVVTYTGRTVLFSNNNIYTELDESLISRSFGYISKDFKGVPSNVDSIFRYTNGLLYFLQDGRYFEYSEFTNSLQNSGKLELSLFGIKCPNISLYEQLKLLLTKIISLIAN